jgi:hypothetical protein
MGELTYIYSLEFPEGNIRYIGKADNPRRRFQGHIAELKRGTFTHKQSWLKSLINIGEKPILNIIEEVNKESWEIWERYYIALYKSWGFRLTNSTGGGDGNCGENIESRRKSAEKQRELYRTGKKIPWNKGKKTGLTPWNKNLKQGEDFKNKIKQSLKEHYKDHTTWNKGKKCPRNPNLPPVVFSEETKIKMKESRRKYFETHDGVNKGKKSNPESVRKMILNKPSRKDILQFDLDGNFIKEWESSQQVAREIKCFGVSSVCKGEKQSSGGYLWVFKEEFNQNPDIIKEKIIARRNIHKHINRDKSTWITKKIIQLDPYTKEQIKIWDSISEARNVLGKGNIGRACRVGLKANGFYWRYLESA